MYEISKRFEFSAAHQLKGLPEGHQCGRLHGHNYIVEVVLQSETLNEHGFVVDYGDLKRFREDLDVGFEHRDLNETFVQPTAEILAEYFFKRCREHWPQIVAVRVSETPKTWATFCPNEKSGLELFHSGFAGDSAEL